MYTCLSVPKVFFLFIFILHHSSPFVLIHFLSHIFLSLQTMSLEAYIILSGPRYTVHQHTSDQTFPPNLITVLYVFKCSYLTYIIEHSTDTDTDTDTDTHRHTHRQTDTHTHRHTQTHTHTDTHTHRHIHTGTHIPAAHFISLFFSKKKQD